VDATALRLQAERCRRLAKSIYNSAAVAELEAYAGQLEERAARLDETAPAALPWSIGTGEPSP